MDHRMNNSMVYNTTLLLKLQVAALFVTSPRSRG